MRKLSAKCLISHQNQDQMIASQATLKKLEQQSHKCVEVRGEYVQ
jgi:hypothetical protein